MDPNHTRLFMKTLTRYLGLAFKLLVFLLVLGFALKNSHTVIFYSYLDYVWQAPLIVMLGLAFVLGALTGVLALLPTLFRLRRENARKSQTVEADTIAPTDISVV
jgi:putative membrane protein